MAALQARPLRAIERERGLWVDRPQDVQRLRRSVELNFNTLVLGSPGSGVTSLLNVLVAWLEDERDRRVARVSARWMSSPTELLDRIADTLGRGTTVKPGADALETAYRRLTAAAGDSAGTLIVVDDVSGAAGHRIFGRLRDELWELGMQWLVGGRLDEEAVLLAPPADAFFETVHRLEPLTADQIEMLLKRRDPGGQIKRSSRRVIAEQAGGSPRKALELARRSLVDEAGDITGDVGLVERVARDLGEPAARLVDELLRYGPASPSDSALQQRLGWSASRAYQVFSQIDEAGLVTTASERSGLPGRPRKLFRVVGA